MAETGDHQKGESLSEPRYRLLLADDQSEIRGRIRAVLAANHDIVGEVTDGLGVSAAVRKLHPDIVLLDISMPEMSGFAVMRQLARDCLTVKVVLVTQHTEPAYVDAAQRGGADGYVFKSQIQADLAAAIRYVGRGGRYFPAALD